DYLCFRLVVNRHVRVAEPVDRLLGIAHKKEATSLSGACRRVDGEGTRDVELPRIGVLEVVNEHSRVAVAKALPDSRIGLDRIACQTDEIVERQSTVAAPCIPIVE